MTNNTTKPAAAKPADYIKPFTIKGMKGRVLTTPMPKGRKREILMVYGHHSSLERWWGLIQVFGKYGAVTLPDLPGFGGMDSFYTIGQKPTMDNMADYLAEFVKQTYRGRRITIVGMSFGFATVTRMLQRHPEMVKKVDVLVSIVGFVHNSDFQLGPVKHAAFKYLPYVFEPRPMASFFRNVFLHPLILRTVYTRMGHAKFKDLTPEQKEAMLQVEIDLWRMNDAQTYMYTTTAMFTLDNCKQQVDLPVWHVGVKDDHFFSNERVEQHMRVTFKDFNGMMINLSKHAPTVIADAKDAEPFVPPALRKVLATNPA